MPGTPTNVRVGPGTLYVAPVGSTEPTDLSTALDAAWVQLGYTHEGSSFAVDNTFEDIEVEEEYDAIDTIQTMREINVAFEAAELTATNLQRAFNGGTITESGTVPNEIVTFEPPAAGTITRVAILWESDDAKERWVFRRCVQTGSQDINRRKGANKATVAMEFRATVPDDGGAPFKVIMAKSF